MEFVERMLCARPVTTGLTAGVHPTFWETVSPGVTLSVPDTTNATRTKLVSSSSAKILASPPIPTSVAKEQIVRFATTSPSVPAQEGSPEIRSSPAGLSPGQICVPPTHAEKELSVLLAATDPDPTVQSACVRLDQEETHFANVPEASVPTTATVAATELVTTSSALTLAMTLAESRPSARL